ncbi:MAG: glutathione S-transferase N-terminal domain-containing protein [Gammaproteobacteria bacterium]|nr:glutathione S-transferase N-terminal domain-containing protein [Gammaproteobacteria bacterium]
MKFIRWLLGRIILLVNWLSWPHPGVRTAQQQQAVEATLAHYALYQFHACPFCVKVRRALRRLNLPMTLRDAKAEGPFRRELAQQGGTLKVPCLRIEHPDGRIEWLYESNDIIAHLEQRFPL